MTHDELTIRIMKLSEDNDENWKFYPALRAVVAWHKPRPEASYCSKCRNAGGHLIAYPCPTIEAIEKEVA